MLGGYSLTPLIDLLTTTPGGRRRRRGLKKRCSCSTSSDVKGESRRRQRIRAPCCRTGPTPRVVHQPPELPQSLKVLVFQVPETNADLSPRPTPGAAEHSALCAGHARTPRGREPGEDKRGQWPPGGAAQRRPTRRAPPSPTWGTWSADSSRKSATNSVLNGSPGRTSFVPNKRFGGVCLGGKIADLLQHHEPARCPSKLDVSQMGMGDRSSYFCARTRARRSEQPGHRGFRSERVLLFDEVRAIGPLRSSSAWPHGPGARGAGPAAAYTLFPPRPKTTAGLHAQKMVGRACGVPQAGH